MKKKRRKILYNDEEKKRKKKQPTQIKSLYFFNILKYNIPINPNTNANKYITMKPTH